MVEDHAMVMASDAAGRATKTPSRPAIGRMLANLHRGNAHLILENVGGDIEGSW
jgi:hypothetical protein